jgi:hypothetical protein
MAEKSSLFPQCSLRQTVLHQLCSGLKLAKVGRVVLDHTSKGTKAAAKKKSPVESLNKTGCYSSRGNATQKKALKLLQFVTKKQD